MDPNQGLDACRNARDQFQAMNRADLWPVEALNVLTPVAVLLAQAFTELDEWMTAGSVYLLRQVEELASRLRAAQAEAAQQMEGIEQ